MRKKRSEYRQLIKRLDKDISAVSDKDLRKKLRSLLRELGDSVFEVYIQAITDAKTGIYNNHFFETILGMEIDKARRGEEKLCLAIIDIDFFKKINDTYGHIKADEMLKRLATILERETRKSDVVARFGGEEFIILFPESGIRRAKQILKRITDSLKHDIFLQKYGLTVSGGVTQFLKNDTPKKIKQRVDKGLYKAKNSGRNKIVVL